MKNRPEGVEVFHEDGRMDGRTDMPKLTVAFRNFANVTKNCTMGTESFPGVKRPVRGADPPPPSSVPRS